jgi:hypothetical protein
MIHDIVRVPAADDLDYQRFHEHLTFICFNYSQNGQRCFPVTSADSDQLAQYAQPSLRNFIITGNVALVYKCNLTVHDRHKEKNSHHFEYWEMQTDAQRLPFHSPKDTGRYSLKRLGYGYQVVSSSESGFGELKRVCM